ncbi:hypothetical protein [Acidomonas methanolica]|uniref:Uncharacterized protein n=1 Tax=Acidomonas methanolica NBRC 104435 TaxID=1231351 RepID=A0A023D6F6_ACIMT|nr:hypothetical protein [Acidomonas methanolica]TCS24115.1 hypothetical protein EDC31_12536 [Acidomonas methanolica]GAJ29733.1 hypothetical protein Amme_076_026 [Acidomonas methanolica NBRC 104435]GBQ59443.1 hypothetical protein AA0498_2755 [Acidomonas methanolica]GEL00030.1 hypothetical protein AME01nite_25280 [Acidomonas methanolica NBRC 104435]
MTGARDLNSPLASQITNEDGTLTAQGTAFLRRLWERTGYAPGVDAAWLQTESDEALLQAALAEARATAALSHANEALDLAMRILGQALAIEAVARKSLELAQDCATLAVTTGLSARAGNSDAAMIYAITRDAR